MRIARLKRVSGAYRESPEQTLLGDLCERHLAQAFGEAQSFPVLAGEDVALPNDVEAVLVQGMGDTLLSAESLVRMRFELEQGASVVLPSPLHEFSGARNRPVYSLRGFEVLERGLLARKESPSRAPNSHLPVSLFSRPAYDRLRAKASVDAILGDESLLRDPPAGGETIGRSGVYFQFSDYYGEVRKDVLPYLPNRVGRLLEIGCARGHTGAFLKAELKCHVTGVELNAEIAGDASRRLDRVLRGDFEVMEFGEKFDAVVATELLEHLRWPERALRKIHGLLAKGGRAVLTTPNVGHYSIVQDLLAGRWDYIPAGLLCYTHFRFFTRRTLENAMASAGISKFQIVPQLTELPEWSSHLPEELCEDRESLGTKGFYVILEADG